MKKNILILITLVAMISAIWTTAYFQKSKIAVNLLGEVNNGFPQLSFKDIDSGKDVSLKPGKEGTLVHFWATWCPACISEMPELLEYIKTIGAGQKAYIIAASDKLMKVKKFLAKYDIKNLSNVYFLIDETGSNMKKMGTFKLPETYLFESDGSVHDKISGTNNWKLFAPKLGL